MERYGRSWVKEEDDNGHALYMPDEARDRNCKFKYTCLGDHLGAGRERQTWTADDTAWVKGEEVETFEHGIKWV